MILPKIILHAVQGKMSRFGVLCLSICFVGLQAYADNGGIKLNGFGGGYSLFARENIWVQNDVSLTNSDASSRSVLIEIPTQDPEHGKLICLRDFEIPAHSRMTIPVITREGDIPASRAKEIKGVSSEIPIIVYDKNTGQKILQNFRKSTVVAANSIMMGFIGEIIEPADEYSYIAKNQIIRNSRVITSNAGGIPNRWYGHDILDIAVINGMVLNRYTPSQIEGLLDWVSKGGVMAVMSSELNADVISGQIEKACGVSVAGVHRASRLDVESNEINFFNKVSIELSAPFPMTELCVEDAEVIARANGLPFITRKAFGEGWVFTIACTAGALNLKELEPVWNFVNNARSYRPAVDSAEFAAGASKTLNELAGRRTVNQRVPAGIIVVLAVVGGGVWLIRLKSKTPERSWIYLVPLCIAVSLGMGWWGMNQADTERLSYVALISGSQPDRTHVQSLCSYYPGGEGKEKAFAADSPRGVVQDVGKSGSSALGAIRLETGDTLRLPSAEISPGATKAIYIDEIKPLEVIQAQISFNEAGVVGSISNSLDVDLQDAVIFANNRVIRIGDLPSGQMVDITGNNKSTRELGDYTGKLVKSEGDSRRNELLFKMNPFYKLIQKNLEQERSAVRSKTTDAKGKVVSKQVKTPTVDTQQFARGYLADLHVQARRDAVVIAHGQYCPVNPVFPADGIPAQGMCLVSWPVEIIKPHSGSKVMIPSAWVTLDLERAALWNPRGQEFRKSATASGVAFTAEAPSQVGKLENATAEMNLNITAADFDVEIRGVPTSSKFSRDPRVVISKFTKPSGILKVSIPDADRFVTEDGRGFKIEVHVSPSEFLTGKAGPGGIAQDIMKQQIREWQILGIEVSLEGTAQ